MNFARVPLTPDGTLEWRAIAFPNSNATLFLPGIHPAQEAELGDLLLSGQKGQQLYDGESGSGIYESPLNPNSVVIKEFNSRIIDNSDVAERGQLPTLRAHVLLAAGLDKINQSGPWRIRGVQVLGAFMMHNTEGATESGVLHARWAMERLHPQEGANTEDYMPQERSTGLNDFVTGQERVDIKSPRLQPALPSYALRHHLYNRAIAEVAGRDHSLRVDFDDHHQNMIIERLPQRISGRHYKPGIAVKFDVQTTGL